MTRRERKRNKTVEREGRRRRKRKEERSLELYPDEIQPGTNEVH